VILGLPLGYFGIAALAFLGLSELRARTPRAWATIALLAAGAVPWRACARTSWMDAMGGAPTPAAMWETALTLAAHGPRWGQGGGFAGDALACSAPSFAVATAWVVGLALVTYGSGRRRSAEPPAAPTD